MGYTTLKAALDSVVKTNGQQQITGANLNDVMTTLLQGVDVLDRANPSDTSGMNQVVLKKNKTFAEQVTSSNTIYVVRDQFDLSNASFTMPIGSVLKFEGGQIKNGILTGAKTGIIADFTRIFDTITLLGSYCIESIPVEWFGGKNDGATDNHDFLQAACDNSIRIGVPVSLLPGTYVVDESKGAIYINFGADGQKFELIGAGSGFTTIKTADGSIDRYLDAGNNPRYLHTFYCIPGYGGVYSNSYNASLLRFSGIKFDKNKRGTTATPSTEYAWESNNVVYCLDTYNSLTGYIDNYVFDDIEIYDKPGSGLTLGCVTAKSVVFRDIVDRQESNDWGYREGIYPLAITKDLLIEHCSIVFVQIEPTSAQAADYHCKAKIIDSNISFLEWSAPRNGVMNYEEDALLVQDCFFDNAYINMDGQNMFVQFVDCHFVFKDPTRNNTIWNSERFVNCLFDFVWDTTNLNLPSIMVRYRVSSDEPKQIDLLFDNCIFRTTTKPTGGEGTIFKRFAATSGVTKIPFRKFVGCEFHTDTSLPINESYLNGDWEFVSCLFDLPQSQNILQVGSSASGSGKVSVKNCKIKNGNILIALATSTASTDRGKIVGEFDHLPLFARGTGNEAISMDGKGMVVVVDSSTAVNVRLPKGAKVIKDGIIYEVIANMMNNVSPTLTPAFFKCEFVNKFMDTTTRTALTLPAIPMEAFDTTLNKPVYWTGSAWVDATGASV